MNDLYLAASPPQLNPLQAVQPAARKVEERDAVQRESSPTDFESVLKAKEKEMRSAGVSRTAHPAVHHKVRPPENSSQGGTEKVEAAVAPKEATPLQPKAEAQEVADGKPKEDETQVDQPEKPIQAQASGNAAAGAGGVTAQPVIVNANPAGQKTGEAVTPAKDGQSGQPAAVQAVGAAPEKAEPTGKTATPQIGKTADLAQPEAAKAQTAPAASADGKPGVEVNGGANAQQFAKTLAQAQKADTPAAQPAPDSQPDAVQSAAAAQQQAPPLKTPQTALLALETAVPAAQKAVKAVDGAGGAGAQQGLSSNGSSAQPQISVQPVQVKEMSAAFSVQNAAETTGTRALDMIQQVAKTVEASVQQGRNSLRMQLNPADLGALDIRLVSSGHRVSMTVIAEQASTGRLLETQVEQLRQNLAQAGVQLSQMNISQQDSGGFARGFAQQQSGAASRSGSLNQTATETNEERPARVRSSGMVDYRV